jgi:hypothetical protein
VPRLSMDVHLSDQIREINFLYLRNKDRKPRAAAMTVKYAGE